MIDEPAIRQVLSLIGQFVHVSDGSPEGVLAAQGICYDKTGQQLFVKDSGGVTPTGWVGK